MNYQKDNLAELLERTKKHHLQTDMEVTLTIAELERMLNDFLDVAIKEPKWDSRDFLLEALSNLNEEKIVAIDKYKRKLIKNRNQDISIDVETLETIKRYTSFFE